MWKTSYAGIGGEALKTLLKRLLLERGLYLANSQRLGLDVDLDLRRLTGTDSLRMIFDVGANIGQTAQRLAKSFPGARIFSFEPVPQTYFSLSAAVQNLPRVSPFNVALGDAPGFCMMQAEANSGSNTMKSGFAPSDGVNVPVNTIDRFCAEHSIESIDLLKIDVEGFELPVLRGAKLMMAEKKIRFVFAECVLSPNPSMPHTSFFDIHALLTEAGFCFVDYFSESFHLSLGCAMGNVLYALRSALPTSVPGDLRNIVN